MIAAPRAGSELTAPQAKRYAQVAGLLFLLSIAGGGFGEFWAPTRLLVAGNAAATALNVHTHDFLLRAGFAGYLVEATCDITLAWLFYVLLRPVHRNLALLSAFFGLIATATFACFEIFYFAPTFILGGADYLKTFTPDQLNSLAMLSFKFYSYGSGLLMVFYGTEWVIRGYLMYHSGYFPRILGAVMTLAGAGFIIKNAGLVFLPGLPLDFVLLPMFVGGMALMGWLLIRGVDVVKWTAKAETR
jgi:hypothetical protein